MCIINKKKIICQLVLICLLVLYFARVILVNLRYDKPDIVIYKKGDVCTYGDFSFCMKTKEFMTYDEIRRNFSEIKEDYSVNDGDLFMIVGFDVTYNGDEEKATPKLTSVRFQSEGWFNGEEYAMLSILNPAGREIMRGETKRIHLAVYTGKITFADKDWMNVRNRQYNMTLSTYPDVIRMRCE